MTEQNVPPVLPYSSPASEATDGVIVARAYRNYRLTRYALVVFLFGYGLWSLRDGFIRYPKENADAVAMHYDKLPHPGYDVQFNQAFGIALPPLSLALLAWVLYASRGEFRFDGNTLTAPGHPPVPVSAITAIDRSKWDRKSIAYVLYKLPDGESGKIKFDHSLYDPVDRMFKAVESAVQSR